MIVLIAIPLINLILFAHVIITNMKINFKDTNISVPQAAIIAYHTSIIPCSAPLNNAINSILPITFYTVAINSIFEVQYSYVFIGIITAILSIAGQLGDFAASSIKRYVDIKFWLYL